MKLKIFILISTLVCQFSLVAQSNNILYLMAKILMGGSNTELNCGMHQMVK